MGVRVKAGISNIDESLSPERQAMLDKALAHLHEMQHKKHERKAAEATAELGTAQSKMEIRTSAELGERGGDAAKVRSMGRGR